MRRKYRRFWRSNSFNVIVIMIVAITSVGISYLVGMASPTLTLPTYPTPIPQQIDANQQQPQMRIPTPVPTSWWDELFN